MIRYLGLCGFIIASFMRTTFLPGPAKLCWVLEIINIWVFVVYICAADFVMILRIWAMYNRSKIILGVLLTSYLGEIIPSTISIIFYSYPKNFAMIVNQILDIPFCSLSAISGSLYKASNLSQLVHAVVMYTLVIIQFTIRSVEMYRATKKWRIGPFINLLVMEGMVYFFAILMWDLIDTLYVLGNLSAVGPKQHIPLRLAASIPISTLNPRFILSIREMYARNTFHVGRGQGIDTGFGLTALPSHESSLSWIVSADGGERAGLGHDSEDTQIERTMA